jgi:hypothetical protein
MRSLAFVRFAAAWLLFATLYLLLAGEVSATEIEAGAPLAILTVAFVLLQRRIAARRLSLPLMTKAYIRPLAALLPDAVRVGKVILVSLVHRPAADVGHLLRQPFQAGGSSPAEAGRQAVVELGLSLAPNAFAVCLRPQDDELLLHCLHPKQASPDRAWPT